MSTITIKRYSISDIDQILNHIGNFLQEDRGDTSYENHYKSIDFNRQKVYNTLISRNNDPDLFCNIIYLDQEIVGGLCAFIAEPFFSSERIAYDQLLYVTPSFKNVAAVIRLIKSYTKWAEQRSAVECRLCASTGFNHEAFTKLCKLTGFRQFEVGFARRF